MPLNWYGQTMMEYQKSSCVYCLADVAHRQHLTVLECEQMNIPAPERPSSDYLREVIDQGGFDAIARRQQPATAA